MAAQPELAPAGAQGKPACWRNLNVFIAAFALFAAVGAWALVVPIGPALKLFLAPQRAEIIAFPASYVVLAAGLAWYWWRFGLSPAVRRPEREGRFRKGHVLLAFGNMLAVGAFASPALLPSLLMHTKQPALAMFVGTVLPIAGACFVFYVTTVIWLLGAARHGAATAVAWAPVLLGIIGLPALQLIAMLFGSLLGK